MRALRGHQSAAAGTAVLMMAIVLTAPLNYGFVLVLTWLLMHLAQGAVDRTIAGLMRVPDADDTRARLSAS